MGDIQPRFLPERYSFLKSQLEIDLLDMEEQISRIAILVQEASERSAQASEIRDSLKDTYTLVAAQVADKLRKEMLPSGKTRSEQSIESEKPLSSDYQKARDEFAEARLDAALWDSVVEGFRTKSQHLRTGSDNLLAGFITTDYILQKRRADMRTASPPSTRLPLKVG